MRADEPCSSTSSCRRLGTTFEPSWAATPSSFGRSPSGQCDWYFLMGSHAYTGLQAVVRDELESPLLAHTVEELKWYFGQLRATPNVRIRPTDERFERASEAFERPRFYRLYRLWLKEGDSALDA